MGKETARRPKAELELQVLLVTGNPQQQKKAGRQRMNPPMSGIRATPQYPHIMIVKKLKKAKTETLLIPKQVLMAIHSLDG